MKMNISRLLRSVITGYVALFAIACAKDDAINNGDDYGYVQFKLYKEASYESRAVSQLDYLADAAKINVLLRFGNANVSQTVNLSAAGNAAEYGLRSDKLKLLTGEYSIGSFTLYDKFDQVLYYGTNAGDPFTVQPGGLTSYDLTANVTPRGHVRFEFVKTGVDSRAYTLDEVSKADITVQNTASYTERYTFENLKVKFDIHFDEDNAQKGSEGYMTSSLKCDSLLSLPAGEYRIYAYTLYNSRSSMLASKTNSAISPILRNFTVQDNVVTDAKIEINISQEDEYIKDYLALKEIWEALDGPNWYYSGENFPTGCNWNFNKDIDLWGDQPGVQLHANGRVARIDLSDFGVRGDIPESLGQLDQIVELYLGTHNDINIYDYDPTTDMSQSVLQKSRNRMDNNKQYLAMRHAPHQMSEPCARGLREHGIVVPETSLYEKGLSEKDIFDPATGLQSSSLRLKDLAFGKLCNGITSIPKSIGKLKNLEYLYIANGEIASIPDEIGQLESLTDLEIYNCPKMTAFPTAIAQCPELISVNISNNRQWEPDVIRDGLAALASGASHDKIQILYCTDNRLQEMPEEFSQLSKIGLLDLENNEISKLPVLGSSVAPVQLYLDYNEIEEIPENFCQMNDMETFSAAYNKIRKFPNIFKTNGYTVSTIDLTSNLIAEFPSRQEFAGIRVTTLSLSNNPIGKFPAVLVNNDKDSSVAYIVLRGCGITGFEDDCFVGKNSAQLMSLDLSYNKLKKLPKDMRATNLPYLYGVDVSNNMFSEFPYEPFDSYTLTIFAARGQRDENGRRSLREWPTGVYQHTGLRALYLGSNDLRVVNDQISYLIYYLDISDNPNITFDAADICAYWQAGYYFLIYDKTQNIINCAAMLQ